MFFEHADTAGECNFLWVLFQFLFISLITPCYVTSTLWTVDKYSMNRSSCNKRKFHWLLVLRGSLHCLYFIYNVIPHLLTLWSRVRFKSLAKGPVQCLREGESRPWLLSSFLCILVSSLFSNCVLCQQSPTLSIFCCCSPFSSHPFQILLTQFCPNILDFPRLVFPTFSRYLIFLPISHLPFFPHDRAISTYSSPISSEDIIYNISV